jgi:hypothetical protein
MSSKKPLAPKHIYFKRLLKSFLVATLYMAFSLSLGVLGYHFWGKMEWIDALVNASMILGGMGPVDVVKTDNGKIFTSFYALYSGISFLTAFAILIAPALHRLLHKLKLEVEE